MSAARLGRVLIIAGSDSGGGAGIQADIKTITMLGGYAMTAITAITAQNSRAVDAVQVLPVRMVRAQIETVISDFSVSAIKTGMLATRAIVRLVAEQAARLNDRPWVVDPVMIATSGAALLRPDAIRALEFYKSLYKCCTPPGLTNSYMGEGLDAFKSGQVAMMINGPWAWDNVRKVGIDFGVYGVPESFLIDAKGVLRREWRKVKVAAHAQEVLEAVRSL